MRYNSMCTPAQKYLPPKCFPLLFCQTNWKYSYFFSLVIMQLFTPVLHCYLTTRHSQRSCRQRYLYVSANERITVNTVTCLAAAVSWRLIKMMTSGADYTNKPRYIDNMHTGDPDTDDYTNRCIYYYYLAHVVSKYY